PFLPIANPTFTGTLTGPATTISNRITINGANAPNSLALLNIGYTGGGETRSIDLDGGWGAGESKSITAAHGSASTNIVGQMNFQHNGPGSSIRFGKLYHSGDSSTYTMQLVSTSSTTADLTVAGNMTTAGDITVSGGDITLGGISGKISGVVTVISGSDATSKTYVDSAISTAGGAFLPKAGGVMSGKIGRSTAIVGFLEGSYNNVGDNGSNSNPIYTIGSSYNPASTTLSSMYGIGYSHSNASFLNLTGVSGWGMYVASGGTARIFLSGGTGSISTSGNLYLGGGDIVLAGTGRIQGIDTVSATTDAANKAYVDAHGGGVGPFLTIANPTFTGTLTGPAATITTVTGALVGNVTGNVSGSSGSTTGNAATVTNGVYTIGNQTIAGTKTFSSTIAGSISGNAVTAGGLAINTSGTNNVANQIVRTEANGYANFGWINTPSGNHTGAITRITASN
ncbi:MAG: beta strand repeat-containing protein, partial [Methylophagaceae bacterium]